MSLIPKIRTRILTRKNEWGRDEYLVQTTRFGIIWSDYLFWTTYKWAAEDSVKYIHQRENWKPEVRVL